MKRTVLLTFTIAAMYLVSCSNGSQNKIDNATTEGAVSSEVQLNGFVEYDLSDKGFPIIVKAPKGANMEQTASGAVEIKTEGAFRIQITESGVDLAQWKTDIKTNDVNKFKRFVAEDADGLLYESALTGPEFHFVKLFKSKASTYEIQDIKDSVYTEEDAKIMYQAAKEIKDK